jgi:hypothetical protein
MTDRYTFDAAPYVLGALSPDERLAFEAHLAGCTECDSQVREFAGLPGLLSRLPADEVTAALSVQPEPPATLLPALQFAVRRERRSRRLRVAVSGIAAAFLAIAGTAVVARQFGSTAGNPSGPGVIAQPQVEPRLNLKAEGDEPVAANAALVSKAWGTAIDMKCTYFGREWPDADKGTDHVYKLQVTDRSNKTHEVGEWIVSLGREVQVQGSTSIMKDQIKSIQVLNPGEKVVLDLAM